jgi:tetratricopeptide (TPR) repeat protein
VAIGLLLSNIAVAHADCGDSGTALSLSTEAMSLLTGRVDKSDPVFAVSLYAHGAVLHSLGRNSEALRDLREALDIWRHAPVPDGAQIALLNDGIASCLADLGYLNQAEASAREALAIREKMLDSGSPGFAASLNNLGVLLARKQRFSEARQALEKAALIIEQCGEGEQRRLAHVLGNLGSLYYAQAHYSPSFYAKAEDVYRRKLAIEEQMLGQSDVHVAATLEMLGEILYRERAYNEAGRTYGRGLAIQQAAFGPADPKTQSAVKRYNALVKKMKADPAQ